MKYTGQKFIYTNTEMLELYMSRLSVLAKKNYGVSEFAKVVLSSVGLTQACKPRYLLYNIWLDSGSKNSQAGLAYDSMPEFLDVWINLGSMDLDGYSNVMIFGAHIKVWHTEEDFLNAVKEEHNSKETLPTLHVYAKA